ncbi:hypothetical protein L293_2469 [Acinetobacter gyllenbergii CIP 110306 = MTCC 11365]|nr:hypothetical protein L293_2469 [Acinetobacter gyllenbergii CIP 110306 = MTCC 11365]
MQPSLGMGSGFNSFILDGLNSMLPLGCMKSSKASRRSIS